MNRPTRPPTRSGRLPPPAFLRALPGLSIPAIALLALLALPSCKRPSLADAGDPGPDKKTLRVITTTTMVTDMVQHILGDDPGVSVTGLMASGIDPHTYNLPARAQAKLRQADVVFYSGHHLEGRTDELYKSLKGRDILVTAVAESLPREKLLVPKGFEGNPDPHVWGDAALWAECVDGVLETLVKARPDKKDALIANASKYKSQLTELDTWVQQQIAQIPPEHRVLITSHDAFNYFGRAYGLEVIGIQGISTVDQAGLADIAKTTDLIKGRNLKAIFVESSVSPAAIERVARDANVEIGGELFSDALGPAGEMETVNGETYDVGTYIGMLKHNVNTVVAALK